MGPHRRAVERVNNSEAARRLRGKTIKRIDLNAFRDGQIGSNDWTADPRIVFTDGSTLTLQVHETDVGEYGIDLCLYHRDRT